MSKQQNKLLSKLYYNQKFNILYLHFAVISSVSLWTLSTNVITLIFFSLDKVVELTTRTEVVFIILERTSTLFAVVGSASQRISVKTRSATFAFLSDGVMFAKTFGCVWIARRGVTIAITFHAKALLGARW